MSKEKYIIAVEPGSSKIRAALGSVDENGQLTIHAVEEEKMSDSVCYGLVRNVAQVANSISNVINRLVFSHGGGTPTGVYIALGGRSTRADEVTTERRLPADTEVTEEHIEALRQEALRTSLNDRDVITVVARDFYTDNTRATNPVGSMASEIRATYNVINCRSQLCRNLNHVFEKTLQLPIHGFIVRQTAQADMVVPTQEKRLGVMLVDFGAETVTVSIYRQGRLHYLTTLPIGSRNITRDITSLNHLEETAEGLKYRYDEHPELAEIVNARSGEIIANINAQIRFAGLTAADLPAGIVIIGGGARLRGFNARLEQVTKLRVRSGQPMTMPRIADSSIRPTEAIDVISVLAAAAAGNPKECLKAAEATTVAPDPEPAIEPATNPEVPTLGKHPRRQEIEEKVIGERHKSGLNWGERLRTLKDKIAGMVSENDEDDDALTDDN